jgi:CheY-like chemotaxis protein
VTGEPVEEAETDAHTADTPGGSEVVMVVEDDKAVRELTCRVLTQCGYTVIEARNGQQAETMCKDLAGPLQLVITDVVMPDLDGVDLVDRLRKLRPDLPVLYISGYSDRAIVRENVLETEDPFLQKPFSNATLTSMVRSLLDKRHD